MTYISSIIIKIRERVVYFKEEDDRDNSCKLLKGKHSSPFLYPEVY
jgi:hypothetical protein